LKALTNGHDLVMTFFSFPGSAVEDESIATRGLVK